MKFTTAPLYLVLFSLFGGFSGLVQAQDAVAKADSLSFSTSKIDLPNLEDVVSRNGTTSMRPKGLEYFLTDRRGALVVKEVRLENNALVYGNVILGIAYKNVDVRDVVVVDVPVPEIKDGKLVTRMERREIKNDKEKVQNVGSWGQNEKGGVRVSLPASLDFVLVTDAKTGANKVEIENPKAFAKDFQKRVDDDLSDKALATVLKVVPVGVAEKSRWITDAIYDAERLTLFAQFRKKINDDMDTLRLKIETEIATLAPRFLLPDGQKMKGKVEFAAGGILVTFGEATPAPLLAARKGFQLTANGKTLAYPFRAHLAGVIQGDRGVEIAKVDGLSVSATSGRIRYAPKDVRDEKAYEDLLSTLATIHGAKLEAKDINAIALDPLGKTKGCLGASVALQGEDSVVADVCVVIEPRRLADAPVTIPVRLAFRVTADGTLDLQTLSSRAADARPVAAGPTLQRMTRPLGLNLRALVLTEKLRTQEGLRNVTIEFQSAVENGPVYLVVKPGA